MTSEKAKSEIKKSGVITQRVIAFCDQDCFVLQKLPNDLLQSHVVSLDYAKIYLKVSKIMMYNNILAFLSILSPITTCPEVDYPGKEVGRDKYFPLL